MQTKKTKRGKPSARKLVGAVVLTASFSLFAIPDALAESCSDNLGSIFTDGSNSCSSNADNDASDGPQLASSGDLNEILGY